MKAEDGAGYDAERAKGAGDKFGEVVAGNVLDDFAAAGGERAVGKSDRDADDEVAERAETETKRAAVVGRKDAADGCSFRPERIEGEALAVLSEGFLQSLKGAAGFDDDGEVGPGVFEDAIQARRGKDEMDVRGRIAPSEFCAAAARDDDEFGFVGEAEDFGELLFGCGFEEEMRLKAGDGVDGSGRAHMVGAEQGDEFVVERGGQKGERGLSGSIHRSIET